MHVFLAESPTAPLCLHILCKSVPQQHKTKRWCKRLFVPSLFGASHVLWCQSRWLCDPDVVVAMAWEDMQGFKCYVKQGREGAGMLFPGIRIRVDQNGESEFERRGREAPAMRRSKGVKTDAKEK